ncbi:MULTISPECIES: NAD(P)-dependent alcohol dehydrogenase [Paenibacillus]|uniref:Alcohol dehydrogenase n=1 Tax=Paenibacillus odorifer TaxID=189426 RepID=A0ABX3H9P1_9BACL|nr:MULTISPECIES: NAD(P)-dependent alcohol dehydrogenase [Paenibacillus]KAA1185305.1 NAD(P)-dependent alcohol dehydrogenase [Paenibacillus sp. B2(2019)]OMD46931.1 alcohol dehydrogenase [Paenibacillus odorifer]
MLTGKMNAAIMDEQLSISVKQIDIPVPKDNEALIKVYCIGICGSDVHYYEHGRIGRYVVKEPIILGHELAGEVVEVGKQVSNIAVGDRVAVEPGVTCGQCDYCKSGRYNLCPDVVFLATPPVNGAWAEYIVMPSDYLFKLPDSMSYEEGAMLEPLSVGFHAMMRGKVQPFDRVLITGLGPIGLLAGQAAKLFGVSEIYGTDVVPFRRQLAMEMGFTAALDPVKENVGQRLNELTNGFGVTLVVESSGNARAMADTIKWVRRGGRIVFVGLPADSAIPMDMGQFIDGEIDAYGVFRYANTYPAAIQALQHSSLDIEKIVTHRFALTDTQEALEVARKEKDTSIKVMIYPNMP